MGASEDFYASHYVMYEMSVHGCKTTNWWFICLIVCNCLYIVVIDCGWNNNVAVQIVACWNWNIYIYIYTSWLDRHGEFVFTIQVRCDSTGGNSVRSSILWVKACAGWPIWFRPLKLTFSNNNHGPGQWVTLHMQVKSEFLQLLLKKQANRLIASVSEAVSRSFYLHLSSAHRKTSRCLLTEKGSILPRPLPKQDGVLPYQFKPDSDPENIEQEDRAEPLHAQILQDILEW